ncbi:MAG TPA: RnfABCDGE type electron transport complex subunit B [Clostridia bacterium]|jgi:electron transport complex protein RnfB|nr:RnfABCDGE type electron transport complex subunit B [Clostridia bacterium]HOL61564.1 RnfABCDGE type electron transport complex subunit B [Clostridia bacterium]HPO54193.1 RnfABCDGE type electron transport complex subunit B [Clostridia bacterium]
MDILLPVVILTSLATVFAVVIVFVNKKLAVQDDPKVEEILSLLPSANCGVCGKAGCADLARSLVEGKAKIEDCPSCSAQSKAKIAKILGGDIAKFEDTLVICACCGGNACDDKYEYQGYGDCASIELIAGGRKACSNGCIGQGKCNRLCPYDAIQIIDGVAYIDNTEDSKCRQCGICITNCPKKIMKRIPAKAEIYIACSSCYKGKDVRSMCKKGCIACGLCAKICPQSAITMKGNLPIIDYDKCNACGDCLAKCPTKVIRWLKHD